MTHKTIKRSLKGLNLNYSRATTGMGGIGALLDMLEHICLPTPELLPTQHLLTLEPEQLELTQKSKKLVVIIAHH